MAAVAVVCVPLAGAQDEHHSGVRGVGHSVVTGGWVPGSQE